MVKLIKERFVYHNCSPFPTNLSLRTEFFSRVFNTVIPNDEQLIRTKANARGGADAIPHDKQSMQEFINLEQQHTIHRSKNDRSVPPREARSSWNALKKDLKREVDVAVKENFKRFEGRFQLYQAKLKEDLERFIHEEGTRVIETVTANVTGGPHEKIENKVRWIRCGTIAR